MKNKILTLLILASILMLSFNSYSQESSGDSSSADDKRITTCIVDGSKKCKKPGSDCSDVQGCPGLSTWLGLAKEAVETVEKVKSILQE